MSLLPRCICDPFQAIVGNYDPRCNRHIGEPSPTLAPPSGCVCPQPCKWCAVLEMQEQKSKAVDGQNKSELTRKAIAQELRDKCALLRTKPIPLAELIPLMQRAADALDSEA